MGAASLAVSSAGLEGSTMFAARPEGGLVPITEGTPHLRRGRADGKVGKPTDGGDTLFYLVTSLCF